MKTNSYWTAIVSMAGKGCILVASVFLLFPSSVEAQCAQWDVSGKWNMQHSHNLTELDLTQSGTKITGKAKMSGAIGTVKGTIVGNDLEVEISYGKTTVTRYYRGKVGSKRIDGIGFTQAETTQDTWYSTRAMKCAETTTPPPVTPQKPISTKPPPKATPNISASLAVITIPAAQAAGTTTLTWDGGPEHPYAEVWVAVNGQDSTFVVEQGKGSRKVTVERGRKYLYILTDAGQKLATVAVTAK